MDNNNNISDEKNDNTKYNKQKLNIVNSIILIVLIFFAIFLAMIVLFKNSSDSDDFAILLRVGEEYSFSNIDDDFSFSSSNESIAIVDANGNVKAISAGIVTIFVCDDSGIVYEYTIKIVDDILDDNSVIDDDGDMDSDDDASSDLTDDKLEKIVFSSSNLTMYVGDTYQTSIIYFPSYVSSDVTYKSSNNSVATVSSSGVITGVSEGECTITASTEDKFATMKIKIIKNTSKIITVNFNENGANSISSRKEECNSDGNGCVIKLPTITRDGYQILGWSRSNNSNTADYEVGESVTIYGNTTFYAITYKTLSAKFYSNGATISDTTKLCKVYNKANSCDIVTPNIVRDGYNIIGWGSSASATTKSVNINTKLSLTDSVSYYAVTYKILKATFEASKATISKNEATCNIYNTSSSCNVVTPSIYRENYAVLGWGTSLNATSPVTGSEEILTLSKSATYYAITKINTDGIEKGCTGWMATSDYYYSSASTSASKSTISVGTVFTIEEVVGDYFKVSIPNVSGYKYVLHKYVMINLADYIPSMVFEITNANSSVYKSSGYSLSGITGTKLYSVGKVYNIRLRKDEYMAPILYTVAKKLLITQKTLLSKGYSIKVYDTYRPRSVSTKIYNALSSLYDSNSTVKNNILYSYGASGTKYTWGKTWFLAEGVSTHNVGAAIDMSMVNKSTGVEVTMPTLMHELSTKAIKYYSPNVSKTPANYSKEMNDNAKIMDSAATSSGLDTLSSEWWHFQDTSAYNLIKSTQSNGCDFDVTTIYSY